MGATREKLLDISYVVDHDTGMYHTGEIDFGIVCGVLDDYLKIYGVKGRDEILSTLGYIAHDVFRRFEKISESTAQDEVAHSPIKSSRSIYGGAR